IYAYYYCNSCVKIHWDFYVLLCIIASITDGLGAFLCAIYSKQLCNMGWTSSMILSKRFYSIILLSLIFTYDLIFDYIADNIGWILLITFSVVLIPMYLLQKGIQYCATFVVMMSLSFIPVITFFLQMFDPRLQWSNLTLIG